MKKLFLGFLVCILIINLVFATQTEIKIKTLPFHEVQLTTTKANSVDFTVIESFKENSDEYGDLTFLTNCECDEFNIIIYLKKDNKKITAKNFTNPIKINNHIIGEDLFLEMAPDWYEFIYAETQEENSTEQLENLELNDTLVNKENSTKEVISEVKENKETTEETDLTGYSISNNKIFSSKTIIYSSVFIGFLLIGMVFFIIAKKTKLQRKKRDLEKLDKALDEMDSKNKKPKDKKVLMQDLKKKMKEMEEEIEELEKK